MNVVKLSAIGAHNRCPKCGSKRVRRSNTKSGTTYEGLALWVIKESCIVCNWTKSVSNVKAG